MAEQYIDYVDEAEKILRRLGRPNQHDSEKLNFGELTTSKIRSILALLNDIYNEENNRREEILKEESIAKLQMLRVRLVYEAGRTEVVGDFIKESNLLERVKKISNSRKKFIELARYMEALVAYHRFLGGKEK